jgi:DNA-binding transcriptional regulator YiaG
MGEETHMLRPQDNLVSRRAAEHDTARPQYQETELMVPTTAFAILVERCGLSQREAAEFLRVRLDTVKSWCTGRNVAKPAVLAELRGLHADIQAAADTLVLQVESLLDLQQQRGLNQRAIVFGLAETDDVARALGFPSQGPHAAAIGLALLRLPNDVVVVIEPQSYPGYGGGGAAPIVPGTKITWPPSQREDRNRMNGEEKTARELADIVATKVGLGGVSIRVYPDPTYGWRAIAIVAPAQAGNCQQYVEKIVDELRPIYRLKE